MRNREEFLEVSAAARTFIQALRKFDGEVNLNTFSVHGFISDIDDSLYFIQDELGNKDED